MLWCFHDRFFANFPGKFSEDYGFTMFYHVLPWKSVVFQLFFHFLPVFSGFSGAT